MVVICGHEGICAEVRLLSIRSAKRQRSPSHRNLGRSAAIAFNWRSCIQEIQARPRSVCISIAGRFAPSSCCVAVSTWFTSSVSRGQRISQVLRLSGSRIYVAAGYYPGGVGCVRALTIVSNSRALRARLLRSYAPSQRFKLGVMHQYEELRDDVGG